VVVMMMVVMVMMASVVMMMMVVMIDPVMVVMVMTELDRHLGHLRPRQTGVIGLQRRHRIGNRLQQVGVGRRRRHFGRRWRGGLHAAYRGQGGSGPQQTCDLLIHVSSSGFEIQRDVTRNPLR
jgi:hypothetical protein